MRFTVSVKYVNGEEEIFENISQVDERMNTILLFSEEMVYANVSKVMTTIIKSNILRFKSDVVEVSKEDKENFDKNVEDIKKKQEEYNKAMMLESENFIKNFLNKKQDINYIK